MTDFCFGSPNVISISSVCDGELRKTITTSDRVRTETLRRCASIPSFHFKSLEWKNKYYDLIRGKVKNELGAK